MEIYEQAFAAICVLMLLGGLVLLLKHRQPGGLWPVHLNRKPRGLLVVEDRLALSPQHLLYLVQLEGRRILIATHPAGVSFGPEVEEFKAAFERARGGNRS